MNSTRQDAWSQDEDVLLAETVLRYIREGKTQLEAFKEVGKRLSRTPAACGFRWNASVRKQYQKAIVMAKKDRKQQMDSIDSVSIVEDSNNDGTLDAAISLLERMKLDNYEKSSSTVDFKIQQLTEEMEELKKKLQNHEKAWKEMSHVWNLIESSDRQKTIID
ncbi:RsfA family transcriptional regulator [Radiobacillus sp. PE A8.2]|uniref:RsfA family transcriptional regulator n=1 Tax=Radiobacillus sp. PE A8.2 TaxID=3380349 RepID=UPI0038903BF2